MITVSTNIYCEIWLSFIIPSIKIPIISAKFLYTDFTLSDHSTTPNPRQQIKDDLTLLLKPLLNHASFGKKIFNKTLRRINTLCLRYIKYKLFSQVQ